MLYDDDEKAKRKSYHKTEDQYQENEVESRINDSSENLYELQLRQSYA